MALPAPGRCAARSWRAPWCPCYIPPGVIRASPVTAFWGGVAACGCGLACYRDCAPSSSNRASRVVFTMARSPFVPRKWLPLRLAVP
ncbi:conserved hypothetical protein [Ricinus communis]|uniref:Uncharacterized protein n=1 Tax=Ricinus communis TaxID=3988 RepID=B9SFV6_RICCO|nr:conserved hypothetical protein [Ricinus communis]